MNAKTNEIKKKRVSPYLLIILSFIVMITIGAVLLFLPFSSNPGKSLSFIDAFFLSTSASCVTGLSTVASVNEQFSLVGKIVLIVLMEVGGLSIVTLASFAIVVFGKKLGISSKVFLTSALNQNTQLGIVGLIKKIVTISAFFQLVFIGINYLILGKYYPDNLERLFVAIFHTASSFNNAGFDIFGSSSMIDYTKDVALNFSTMAAIIFGGLGFIVIYDLLTLPFRRHLTFHSKIVLTVTAVLIFVPTVFFRLTMRDVNLLESLFTAVTARTAGFATVDFNAQMSQTAAYPLMLVLMFIGASPCSTGGGVKTTTFFTIIISIVYSIFGRKPKAFKREISQESIMKSLTLIMISIAYIIILVILLKIANPEFNYHELVFEAVSAFGTVGVSMGITSSLSIAGKFLICLAMFFGRVGPLSFVSFWSNSFMQDSSEYVKYVEEKIIIG